MGDKLKDINFNKKELDSFELLFYKRNWYQDNMGYDDKKGLLLKVPVKILVPLYLTYCKRGELISLLNEWDILLCSDDDSLKAHGDPNKLRKRYKKLIPALLQGLKKSRRIFFIRKDLRAKYGY